MSKKKLTRLERLLFLAPLLVIVVPWLLSTSRQNWPPSLRLDYPREKQRRSSCQNNLKYIGMAVSQYIADYDGRFPPVKGKPGALGINPLGSSLDDNSFSGDSTGWANALLIYTKSTSIYNCPAEFDTGYIDYWFNSNLSTLPKTKVAKPSSTFLIGEGNDGKEVSDATYSKARVPPAWLTNPNSPAFRHLGGANYLMADGSVHWLKPEQLATFGAGKDLFSIK